MFGVLPGHRDRDRAVGAARLPPELVAARRGARARFPDVAGWHSVEQHPDAEELDGIVIYRWEAPLFFANAGAFRRQIRHLVRERRPPWVVLQCEAITDIDVTAAEMLEQLDDELNAEGRPRGVRRRCERRLQDLTFRYGLFETLDRDHFYPTVKSALEAIQAEEGSAGDNR